MRILYDRDVQEFLLDIPNDEVKQGFISLLANNYFKTKEPADSCIRLFVKALKRGDLEQFRLSHNPSVIYSDSVYKAECKIKFEWD